MFSLSEQPIDAAGLRSRLQQPEAGALVVFEGWVRNHHRGRPVTRLEYEAFVGMAQREGDALIAEIENEFSGVKIACVHRHGDLAPGDVAVWIGATSAHRNDAFRAARLAIEEVKRRLPIWKKEHHPGAQPLWVNCAEETSPKEIASQEDTRKKIPGEVAGAEKTRLRRASALLVGVGGLGCPAALYLSGAGVGQIALVDGGQVDPSHLNHQSLFETGDVGASKATCAAIALRARNSHVVIDPIPVELTSVNVGALLIGRSIVLDCTNNPEVRLLLNDACLRAGVPLVQAAADQWEGVLNVVQPGHGSCLHCASLQEPRGGPSAGGNHEGSTVFGPAAAILGLLQASEAIKVVLGSGDQRGVREHTLFIDLLSAEITRVAPPAQANCPHCTGVESAKTRNEKIS